MSQATLEISVFDGDMMVIYEGDVLDGTTRLYIDDKWHIEAEMPEGRMKCGTLPSSIRDAVSHINKAILGKFVDEEVVMVWEIGVSFVKGIK